MATKSALEIRAAIALGMVGQLQLARGAKLLAPLGLSQSKLAVLQYIADHDAVTISEMSEQLAINQPGISKIVQQLLEGGLVKAGAGGIDKRIKQLSATKKGQAAYAQTLDALHPAIAEQYRDWSAKDLEAFIGYLDKLKSWLDENG